MDHTKKSTMQSRITVLVFCTLIFGFTAAAIIKPPDDFSETENRVLRQLPEIRADSILSGDFEADYEHYLNDQFVFRNAWIGLKTSVERLLFRRESKDIYFAKDGYFIEKHTGSFTTDLAQSNIASLTRFSQASTKQFGADHLTVMIVPNAVDILEDKLPPFASPYNEENYLEQIAAGLPMGVWFDAASVLKEHSNENLYYKTDHHWKTLSAFYVYQEWAKEQGYTVPELSDYEIRTVTDDFEGTIQSKLGIRTSGDTIELFLPKHEIPYTVIRDDTEMKTETDTLYDYSALDTKDKYAVYFGGNQALIKIQTEADTARKILVIKDSYANCLIPFMLGEFDEVDVLDLRYTRRGLSELIAEGEYTDLLVLYNASGFAEDMNMTKLLRIQALRVYSKQCVINSKRRKNREKIFIWHIIFTDHALFGGLQNQAACCNKQDTGRNGRCYCSKSV